MSPKKIKVRLDRAKSPPVLDVVDNGGVKAKKGEKTTIIWELSGELEHSSFAALDGTEPGFQWETRPAAGIFSDPVLNPDGTLEIVDDYRANAVDAEWIYKLRVVHNKTIYATTTERVGPGATAKNPVIINKDP